MSEAFFSYKAVSTTEACPIPAALNCLLAPHQRFPKETLVREVLPTIQTSPPKAVHSALLQPLLLIHNPKLVSFKWF